MTFWHVVGIIALLVSVYFSLNGALKAKGDKLAVLSFVLIPVFAITAVIALSLPQEPGFSTRELIMSIVVGILGLATAVVNHVQTNKEMKRLK